MPRRRSLILSAAALVVVSAVAVANARATFADVAVIQDTNEGTGLGQVQFSANWHLCTTTCAKASDNSYRWTSTAGSTATIRFSGHQISLFGVREPWANIATISIDGGTGMDVDFYANPATSTVVQVYTSPVLSEGTHTLVMTMTPRRNPLSAGGSAITFDRAEVNSGTPPPTTPCNLASRGRPAIASSIQSSSYPASAAVDGNTATRWSSLYSDPQWIRVDLGSIVSICRVVLRWETAYGRSYRIETSNDGTNWTTIFHTTTGDGGVDDLAMSGSGRYVRMYGTTRGTQWGYSLWEFEVYSGSGSPTPSPSGPPPSTPPPGGGAPALSGAGVENPYAFGAWRGKPVQIWETWNNFATWGEMAAIPSVHEYFTGEGNAPFNVRFPGAMSFSQPMWAAGENANTCNSGASDARMRQIFVNLKNAWGNNAWIRLGWEMDGYWFPQNYAPSNPTGWVNCWRRWHGIIKSVDPNFKLVWNPNWASNTDGHGEFDVRTVWPGDQYVDAAGPDYYDFNIDPNATGFNGAPVGINRWLSFVASHNKPFASPEWGLNTPNGGVDDVAFIQQMYDAFQAAKNSPSGLAYESYFNLIDCSFKITDGCNPSSGARYQQLF